MRLAHWSQGRSRRVRGFHCGGAGKLIPQDGAAARAYVRVSLAQPSQRGRHGQSRAQIAAAVGQKACRCGSVSAPIIAKTIGSS